MAASHLALDDLVRLEIDPARPFAVLADVHANIEALQAVIDWLSRRGIAQAVLLGDLIGYGASPQEVLDRVRERGWAAIRGNHEDMLLDARFVERTRGLKRSARKALDWSRRSIDADATAFIASLPLAARIGDSHIVVHGSLVDPRHCYAYIYEFSIDRNAEQLRSLGLPDGSITWYGHTHQPVVYTITGDEVRPTGVEETIRLESEALHLVNPGSVGFSRDGDARAAFAVFDPASRTLENVRIAYDVDSAAKKIRNAGYDAALADRLLAAR